MKKLLASRVAAGLRDLGLTDVRLVPGGLGEFNVFVDDDLASRTNRLLYPSVRRVVEDVQRHRKAGIE